MIQDFINSCFEFSGFFAITLNIIKLNKDKKVRGVHWVSLLFFVAWGYWNIYYYGHLNQPLSLLAGSLLAIANTVYIIQIGYYINKEKNDN